jgi:hypothetical protein
MVAAAGVSLASSALSAGTQLTAAGDQASAARAGQNIQQQDFEQVQKLLGPFAQAGTSALPQLQALLGIGPGGQAGIQTALQGLPGYQFALGQGEKSVQNQFSAGGLGGSGAEIKAAESYATGLAQQNYTGYLGQLQGLAGLGENAAAGVGNAGIQTGTNIASLGVGGASAQAAGLVGAGNSLGQGSLLFSLLNGQNNSANNLSGGFNGSGQQVTPSGSNPFSLTDGQGNLLTPQ